MCEYYTFVYFSPLCLLDAGVIFIATEVKFTVPNAKVLEEKKALVAELAEKMKNASSGVLVDYKGINVEDDTKLRAEMRKNGVEYTVIKNNLIRFAAKEVGFELDDVLHGTTAIAISMDDMIAPAKIVADYAKKDENIFNIKAGFVEGRVIGVDEVKRLAATPSREVLLSKLLGSLKSPVTALAIALNAIVEKNQQETA